MATSKMQHIWIIFLFRFLFILAEECEPPPDISHGKAVVTDADKFTLGTEVKYQCKFGYYISSIKRTATCERDEEKGLSWKTDDIECKPVSCGEPEPIQNGQILGSRYTYPNSVEYICDVGYKLKGIRVYYCGTDGLWSGRAPSCTIITCPKPEKIENGTVNYGSTVYRSVATYNCNDGLHLEGNNTVTCDAEGKWKGILPKCKELYCPEPSDLPNGETILMKGNTKLGSLVIYTCNSGFNLIGNSYAKCLPTGKWSFENPKCVHHCTVPNLGKGKLSKFEYGSVNKRFIEVKPGTKLEHGKKLLLRCQYNYEIPTEELNHGDVEITCNSGNLEPKPACYPVRCRQPPPINGKGRPLENYENTHKSIVVYVGVCSESDIILRNKTAKCNFGKWIIQEARCESTRCHSNTLNHITGLLITNSRYYESEESFDVNCNEDYEKHINEIICKSGVWEIKSLPCKPANCKDDPPEIKNAGIYDYSSRHGSQVRYYCFAPYMIENDHPITCQYGKWVGEGPTCVDSRCNTKELEKYEGVEVENQWFKNNNAYRIVCKEGYDNEIDYIYCKNHKWQDLSRKPCIPGKCTVPYIPNGELKELRISEARWWRNEQRELISVRTGSSAIHGTEYFILCREPYKLQGKTRTGIWGKSISCYKKRWLPKPECLLNAITSAPTFSSEEVTLDAIETTEATKNQQNLLATQQIINKVNNASEQIDEILLNLNSSNFLDKCSYKSIDDNLIAFLNENKIIIEGNFNHGTHLKFSCIYPGKYHLRGPVEVNCVNGTWEPHLPSCHFPSKDDDVIITLQSINTTLLPGNLIMVEKHSKLIIKCNTVKGNKWPRLQSNTSNLKQVKIAKYKTGSEFSFYSFIEILNMTDKDSGNYSCISSNGNMHSVIIKVYTVIHCSIPQSPKNGKVFYNSLTYNSEIRYECNYNYKLVGEAKAICKDDGQWSQAPICQAECRHPGTVEHANIINDNFEDKGEIHYECKYGYRLIGKSTLHCLVTGEWDNQKPICKEIRCPVPHNPINGEVDYYSLTYNSEITYKCKEGYQLIGDEKVKCEYNGQWSNFPTCKEIQICNAYDLAERLPRNTAIINATEIITDGENVTLTCAGENLILLGKNYATCLNGLWKVGKIECVPGCYPVQKPENSSLILENNKASYRLGETIIFSCPENEELDGDLELIFCLYTGWSDDRLPTCIPLKT